MEIAYQKVLCVLLLLLAETMFQPQNASDLHDGNIVMQDAMFQPQPQVASKVKKSIPMDTGPTLCSTLDGTVGFCYSSMDCSKRGGASIIRCADQLSVCCFVEKSCTHITEERVSYFVNPSYPMRDSINAACEFIIKIPYRNVCQIRLDFEQMSLFGSHHRSGHCRRDVFRIRTIPPNNFDTFELCGDNSGQHIYMPYEPTVKNSYMALLMMTSGFQPNIWRIRTTLIDCELNKELMVPPACLQYHDRLAGTLKSFNYGDGHGHYQSNLDYSICIKRAYDTCRIQYSQVENSVFWINSAEGANLSEGIGQVGKHNCDFSSHDYLYIPDGHGPKETKVKNNDSLVPQRVVSHVTNDVFCGRSLSGLAVVEYDKWFKTENPVYPLSNVTIASTVTSYEPGPIVLRFHTDKIVNPNQEVGFHIKFEQLSTGCENHFE